jgi:hypothetical protein
MLKCGVHILDQRAAADVSYELIRSLVEKSGEAVNVPVAVIVEEADVLISNGLLSILNTIGSKMHPNLIFVLTMTRTEAFQSCKQQSGKFVSKFCFGRCDAVTRRRFQKREWSKLCASRHSQDEATLNPEYFADQTEKSVSYSH